MASLGSAGTMQRAPTPPLPRMMQPDQRLRIRALSALCLAGAMLSSCGLFERGPTPQQVRAELMRRMPAGVQDRAGWARDIQAAFAAQ